MRWSFRLVGNRNKLKQRRERIGESSHLVRTLSVHVDEESDATRLVLGALVPQTLHGLLGIVVGVDAVVGHRRR